MQPPAPPSGLRLQLKSVPITTWLYNRMDRLSGTCQGHLAALVAALDRRDEVIEVVANSPDKASALSGVAQLLGIDESQAQTVLDVQLVRFAVKERDRLREQLESLADWSPDGSAEA